MKADVYNTTGKKTGSVDLPEVVFGAPWNEALVHQVVVSMEANARTPVAYTKGRGEVSGGGKKPWQQKGTGRARHGSIRSPIWKGGGVTFGPQGGTNFSKRTNKKMRAKALFAVLSRKLKDGEVLFVDNIRFETPKTAEALKIAKSLSGISGFEKITSKRKNSVLVSLPVADKVVAKSFNNFGNIEVDEARNLNPVDALKYKYIIVVSPEESLKIFTSRAKELKQVDSLSVKKAAKKVTKKVAQKKTAEKKEITKK